MNIEREEQGGDRWQAARPTLSAYLGLAGNLGGFLRRVAGVDGVVPVAVELVPGQDPRVFKGFHVLVGDSDAPFVGVGVEFGVHGQPGGRGDGPEGFDDDFVGFQGSSAPVPADRGEQPVFDLVPLAGAGRQVADGDRQAGLGGELGEFGLPQSES